MSSGPHISEVTKMARSLKNTVLAGLADDHYDVNAVETMVAELEWIRQHKDLLSRLLKFDGTYEDQIAVADLVAERLEGSAGLCQMLLVESRKLPVDNQFTAETLCTPYDNFEWPLMASEYVNFFAGVRAHYSSGHDYGRVDEWLVWAMGVDKDLNKRITKVRVRGSIAAFHQSFPDEATWRTAIDAGVDMRWARQPIMIVRAVALG